MLGFEVSNNMRFRILGCWNVASGEYLGVLLGRIWLVVESGKTCRVGCRIESNLSKATTQGSPARERVREGETWNRPPLQPQGT